MHSSIMREDTPAWYEIGFDHQSIGLVIRISPEAYRKIQDLIRADSPAVVNNILGLTNFVQPNDGSWGFNSVLVRDPAQDRHGMLTWKAVIPEVIKEDHNADWDVMYQISGTLDILFIGLDIVGEESSIKAKYFQLITCETSTKRDIYGGWLAITVSKHLAQWLKLHTDESLIEKVRSAMISLYCRSFPDTRKSGLYRYEFRFQKGENGRFHIDCPGNACDLDPDYDSFSQEKEEGFKLFPHNTDSPIQQLTLLGGVAAICDFYYQSQGSA